MSTPRFSALIDYEDQYVQPLIIHALKSKLPHELYKIISSQTKPISNDLPLLQIRAYESIDFERGLQDPHALFNAYIIRKALIRKHYLSNIIFSWVTKTPESGLRNHFKPAVEFELDYAEFLDDALVEAFELRESFQHNEDKDVSEREWWILKPSMSDRGQGIRLFSSEEELSAIFGEWEVQNPDSGEDEDEDEEANTAQSEDGGSTRKNNVAATDGEENDGSEPHDGDYIMTSHLRHFIAQPYIDKPFLIPTAPYNRRKFHIRTYVVAAGALKVYVYSHMLALFASKPYQPPWKIADSDDGVDDMLQRMRNIHLTNTCIQSDTRKPSMNSSSSVADESVHLLSKLPLRTEQYASLIEQISSTTSDVFRAALAYPTNFQPVPQAFEVFGVDFLVDEDLIVWLLEVNAFPDFAQTGDELRDVVVKGLWEEVMGMIVGPHFGAGEAKATEGTGRLTLVLQTDMRR